jgi:hypothetical protein
MCTKNLLRRKIVVWVEIVAAWFALSIGLPLLYGWRVARLRDDRERLQVSLKTRARLHRFHFGHRFPLVGH